MKKVQKGEINEHMELK